MHEELLKKFKDLQDRLPVWRKQHGIFQTDIMRIEKSAEKIYHEYLDVMIKYRQSRRQHHADQGAGLLQKGIDTLNKVSKIELLTSLSKR